jgi:hypothetical protein
MFAHVLPYFVQPVPFLPGRSVQMGTLFSGLGSQGSVLHPRDVDVHIRTGDVMLLSYVTVSAWYAIIFHEASDFFD